MQRKQGNTTPLNEEEDETLDTTEGTPPGILPPTTPGSPTLPPTTSGSPTLPPTTSGSPTLSLTSSPPTLPPTKAVPPQATVADRPLVTPNPIDLGNLSNFSDILASNNIPFNTSVMLDHQYLPNISGLSDVFPDANSTLTRGNSFPVRDQSIFLPRRKRPSEFHSEVSQKRAASCSSTSSLRRLTRSTSNPVNQNIPKPLNVEFGPPRDLDTDVFVPRDLINKFADAVERNTVQGLETGGILAAQFNVEGGMYNVSHLVIPVQTGRQDSWIVSDERQLTNFFVTHPNVVFLGLIQKRLHHFPVLIYTHCGRMQERTRQ